MEHELTEGSSGQFSAAVNHCVGQTEGWVGGFVTVRAPSAPDTPVTPSEPGVASLFGWVFDWRTKKEANQVLVGASWSLKLIQPPLERVNKWNKSRFRCEQEVLTWPGCGGGEQKQRHDGLSRKIKIQTPSSPGGRGAECRVLAAFRPPVRL